MRSRNFRGFHSQGQTTKIKFTKYNLGVKLLTRGTGVAHVRTGTVHLLRQSKLYYRHGTCGYTAYFFTCLHLIDHSEFYLMHNMVNW